MESYKEKRMAKRIKELESELSMLRGKTRNKRSEDEYCYGTFIRKKVVWNDIRQTDEVKEIPGVPGNFTHNRIYKILKTDLDKPYWREPNENDWKRKELHEYPLEAL